ncbi:MAG: alpha/beta hydrolase, partial [Bacteroidales bacterium]|nr:alpha/beta hydrolase [Bacteroidales bacterium]
ESYINEKKDNFTHIQEWIDEMRAGKLRDTTIETGKGVKITGFYAYADSVSNKSALLIHGYSDNHWRMAEYGYMFQRELGYNVFIPDHFYHGVSGGDHIRMGWLDRLDMIRWMDVMKDLFGEDTQIVVQGVSMGGATTMMISGEKLPSNVKCFIEDSGYTSVWDQFKKELKEGFGLPAFPLLTITSAVCKIQFGWSFKEASALKQVAKCNLPMLFIHGDADGFVLTSNVYPLYEAKPEPKELWIVPDTRHVRAYINYPEEYTRRVKEFTEKYVK